MQSFSTHGICFVRLLVSCALFMLFGLCECRMHLLLADFVVIYALKHFLVDEFEKWRTL